MDINKKTNLKKEQILKKSNKIYEKNLTKDNINYKFIIEHNKKEIIIKCEEYKTKYNINNLKINTNNIFNNIDKAYESIIKAFKNNKVILKEIFVNKKIKLELNINVKINEIKNLEIILLYNYEKKNNNIINKKLNENNKNIINYINMKRKIII